MYRVKYLLILFIFLAGACTVILDDASLSEKSHQEKTFPEEQVTQTNTVIMTNSQTVSTNVVTNTIILTEYLTNTQVLTNTIETVVTNLIISNDVITNELVVTNTEYLPVTNTIISNLYISNTLIQTNEYFFTNTMLSNVDNTISVLLTAPADGTYLADTFTVTGFTPDGNDLAGAMIYIESTNEVMVQAQYSEFNGTGFSTTISVDKEGHYFLWASAWDSGNAIGKSDKLYIIADWSAPQVVITTADGTNVTGNLTITGTAFDRISGLLGVYLSVDGGGYMPVTGLEDWSQLLSLTPGPHMVSVYSRDEAGYVSLSLSISVYVE